MRMQRKRMLSTLVCVLGLVLFVSSALALYPRTEGPASLTGPVILENDTLYIVPFVAPPGSKACHELIKIVCADPELARLAKLYAYTSFFADLDNGRLRRPAVEGENLSAEIAAREGFRPVEVKGYADLADQGRRLR